MIFPRVQPLLQRQVTRRQKVLSTTADSLAVSRPPARFPLPLHYSPSVLRNAAFCLFGKFCLLHARARCCCCCCCCCCLCYVGNTSPNHSCPGLGWIRALLTWTARRLAAATAARGRLISLFPRSRRQTWKPSGWKAGCLK